jgi:hypothetical protein
VKSYRLTFPTEVTVEAVAAVLVVLAGEGRGTVLAPAAPVSFETVISCASVSWWVRLDGRRARRLQAAAERSLPGLRWEPAERPALNIARAIELRVDSPDRLLAVERAEAAIGRLLGVSVELGPGEVVLVQWQIGSWMARSPIPPAASGNVSRSVWNLPDWGTPARSSEQVQAARKKQAEPVFAAVGRIAVAGASGRRAGQLIAAALGGYQILRSPGVGVSQRVLPSWWVRRRLDVDAVPQLGPAIRFTATELATVIGWPVGNPALGGVRYAAATRLPLDERCLFGRARPGERILGTSAYPAQSSKQVRLTAEDGLRHLHVIGPTGVGKSTLLANLILADITAGRAVVVIDPKGDLIDEVLARVPDRRADAVVVMDPTDSAPVGFNPLVGGTVGIDGVLHVLHSLWAASWGPRLGDILHAGLLTLSSTPGHSLVELPLLLTDASLRRRLVPAATTNDPLGLGTFWAWYEGLSDDARAQALAPVMNKLRAFLMRPELRAVLGQAGPRFALREVFTGRKALLVRLPKGQLGSEGAQLLGSLLVAHLWRLSLARVAVPADRRHPTFFYLDEFQEFLRLPVDLGDALVQARGLGVGLVLAHQHLDQLDRPVRSAVLANAASRVVFHLDHDDAAVLAKRSGGRLRPEDLSGLGAFEAYASVLVGGEATPYGSLATHPLPEPLRPAARLLDRSRQRYGVPATDTEAVLRGLLEMDDSATSRGRLGGRRTPGATT